MTPIVLTADNEEPNCMRCDYVNQCTGGLIELADGMYIADANFSCGPHHFWKEYRRTVISPTPRNQGKEIDFDDAD